MWNKDRFKDPTTVNARTPQQQPKESVLTPRDRAPHPFDEDLSQPPQQRHDKSSFSEHDKERFRRYARNNPKTNHDHSSCTFTWCAHAVGNKAQSWAELNQIYLDRYNAYQAQDKERQRKDRDTL
jgi:hypothetical protein